MRSSSAGSRRKERHRVTIHESVLARVEDAYLPAGWVIPPLCESVHQIILPYNGLFACSVGRQRRLIDANWTLFISPGQEYVVHHPLADTGDAALIVTPSAQMLDELWSTQPTGKRFAFTESSRPSSMPLRLMTQHLLRFSAKANDPLRFDESVILALQEAFRSPVRGSRGNSRSIVECAKEILHSRIGERVSLDDVAREIGVTPVYLTQEFARQEGVPLYRYFQHLRLSRALIELPRCGDITGLALDLGYSSHSHFSSLFRKVFGLSPSEYRSSIGARQLRIRELISRGPATAARDALASA